MPTGPHRTVPRRAGKALGAPLLSLALLAVPRGAGAVGEPARTAAFPPPVESPAGDAGGRGESREALRVGKGERLLVVAPHPDDEILGAGGLVQRVLERGGRVRVLLLTAGDGYVDAVRHETGTARPPAAEFIAYGERRLGEARAAARVLGRGVAIEVMGFPDGGLDLLLRRLGQPSPPMHSATTGASDPPYDDEALEPDLPYDGLDLRRAMGRAFREARPTIVAIPDPADVHPDHRATAAFSLLALSDLAVEGGRSAPRPRVLGFLVHWPDWPPGWNRAPRPEDVDRPLDLPRGLPRRDLATRRLALTPSEIATKRAALAQHVSQAQVMPEFLGAFVRREEVFREIPAADARGLAPLIADLRVSMPPGAAPAAASLAGAGGARQPPAAMP